ncbi:hypothetical protein E3N88_15425 [Mikania micrantha]|uniref:DUF4408 domain-containing protein n=1 Tax=Mikania micrantha TaxID=192012 RepID=A0A5N6NYK4_9ASTR|nr:hypothetical protein E3N88_15425 [Mikania micrantha]
MEPLRIHAYNTRALKKHKAQQLLNDFILYSLTTFACTSFCSSRLWYPPFSAALNVFFFIYLPNITSFFITSKALFIVGNLIVIILLGESNVFASMSKDCNDVCHDKNERKRVDQIRVFSLPREENGGKILKDQNMQVEIFESESYEEANEWFELYKEGDTCESHDEQMVELSCNDDKEINCSKQEGLGGDGDVSLPVEELNKLADDFIARIIRQRRLEAEFDRG